MIPRLVLDTNILISSLIRKNTAPYQLYVAWREGKFDLITSHPQIDELKRVLAYEKLQRFFTREEAQEMLLGVMTFSVCVASIPEVSYSPDPDDNKIIATAIAGQASYIVTGDKRDLLDLKSVEGVKMLTAQQASNMFVVAPH